MDILTSRQQQIVNILNEKEQITINELANYFHVTTATIRRELTLLAEKGLVVRKHGYAYLNNRTAKDQSTFGIRLALHSEEKMMIAQRAIQYISPEDSAIILDSGTSTYALAQLLATQKSKRRLSIISNCLPIATCCSGAYNIICGGTIDEASLAMIGHEAEDYFDTILADIAFIGANGVVGLEGPSVSSLFQMGIKRKMMSRANKKILLLDSHKFKSRGVSKLCDFKDFYVLITVCTEENSEQIFNLRREGIRVDCANDFIVK